MTALAMPNAAPFSAITPKFTHWDHWNLSALAPTVEPPPLPESAAAWDRQLQSSTVREFDRRRRLHHNQLPPIHTAGYQQLYRQVEAQLDDNEGREPARPGSLLIGPPGAGKSCLLRDIGRVYTRERLQQAEALGWDRASKYVPCVHVVVPGTTTLLGFNKQLLNFLRLPTRGTKDDLSLRIINAAEDVGIELFLIDDVNAIQPKTRHGQELSQHIKHLMSSIAGTFVFAGTELADHTLLNMPEGGDPEMAAEFEQTSGRIVRRELPAMAYNNRTAAQRWSETVRAFERRFVLRHHQVGDLNTPTMGRYLHDRTQGYLGSLSQLLMQGANLAITEKTERVDFDVLEQVKLDSRAERSRASTTGAPARKAA